MTTLSTTTLVGRTIGTTGLGLMQMNFPGGPTTEEAIAVMKAALDSGCNFWNGGEFYGTPENNSLHLLHAYFTKYPNDAPKVVLSIKGAYVNHAPDCSPEGIRRSVDRCNAILAGTKTIDIFQCARVDKNVPIETSIGTLKELVAEGKIGAIGVSEIGAEKLARAIKSAPIAAVEVEVSLVEKDIFTNGVAELCAKHGIPIIGYGPFVRGLVFLKSADEAGILAMFPRFQGEALEINLKLAAEIQRMAAAKGCSVAQLCISWVKQMSKRGGNAEIIPLPGSTNQARARANLVDVVLTEQELSDIDEVVGRYEIAGERYPAAMASNWET